MSGADHRRPTLRLDPARLEALAKDAVPEPVAEVPTAPAQQMVRRIAEGTAPPVRARRNTIEDPLTTQLLAEVARRTKTMDLERKTDPANNLATPRRKK